MRRPQAGFAVALLMTSFWLMSAARSEAAAYTVTDLGRRNDIRRLGGIVNEQTGVKYPFVNTVRALTRDEMQGLPGGTTVLQTGVWSQTVPFTMQAEAINNAGTVLGIAPAASGTSNPWSDYTFVYAVRSPDGKYGPMIDLSAKAVWPSQANQMLIDSPSGTRLLDVASGVTTPIDQLVTPDFLKQYSRIMGENIDDRGDLFVYATAPDGHWESFLLTPPGLAQPVPTPEPSTILLFGLLAGALGLRTAARRLKIS
jgi:hypothetical protein